MSAITNSRFMWNMATAPYGEQVTVNIDDEDDDKSRVELYPTN